MSFILTGSEDQHTSVCDCVVRQLSTRPIDQEFRKYMNQELDDYLSKSRMGIVGTWAKDTEIRATPNLLGHDIVVYFRSGQEMRWIG